MIIQTCHPSEAVLASGKFEGRGPRRVVVRMADGVVSAALRLRALIGGRPSTLSRSISAMPDVLAPQTPASRAMEIAPTNTVEVIERTAMTLRIGSGVLNKYFEELAPRYGGFAALVAIRVFPDILVDLQVHTGWDIADMSILGKDLDKYGQGLAHDARTMCAAINMLKGWGAQDQVSSAANAHIDIMFQLIQRLEGMEDLSRYRREIGLAFLNVQEARVYMYQELVAKGYEIPDAIRDWVGTQPAMRDIQLAIAGVASGGKKTLRILLDALMLLYGVGVEGLTIMAYVEGEGRIRNWIEGLANEGGELKAFVFDPRLDLGDASTPERRHIGWKDDLVELFPVFRRGIESRHLRQAWLYPDERTLPEDDPTQTEET